MSIGDLPFADQLDLDTVESADVVIVGGGAAGVAAAVGARQAAPNARIIILESEACLGGAMTHRGVAAYCGLYTIEDKPRQAIGSIWNDLKRRLLKVQGTTEDIVRHRGVFQMVEPECVKLVLDDVMADYNIEVLLHTPVVGAIRNSDNTVASVRIQERRGYRDISAKAFIDCSGDGDLAAHSGASVRLGNHGTINLGSLATRYGGLPHSLQPTATIWRNAIIAAKKKDPNLRKALPKDGSVLLRLPTSGDVITFMASAFYDPRTSAGITAAEVSGRKQAQMYLDILRKLPGHENMYIVSTGPNFGTRETLHINAVYQLVEDDLTSGRHFEDVIALGAWGMEFHDVNDRVWASTFKYIPNKVFDIPLRCLQSIDTPNLLAAGRCVDGDQYASSSVRVMGTALATGQAAGVAAGMMVLKGLDRWAVVDVQNCLRENGAFLRNEDLPIVNV
ncbi:hypothetical protein ACEPPN_015294 [Leptodophora sp. 'Broadleaf-Isolate-01']